MHILIVRNNSNSKAVDASLLLATYLATQGADYTLVDSSDLSCRGDHEGLNEALANGVEMAVVLGGDGTAIEGLYHLAGEFCPRQADEGAGVTEGTVKTIGILDYSRESVGGAAAKDSSYLYSFLEAQGTCDVHTTAPQPQEPEEYDPNSFVISDPSTWPPVNDPRYENFDPENPATWPNAGQPSETPSPGESGQPNPPETSTSPTPSPVPTPVETPPDEPYIPADGTK